MVTVLSQPVATGLMTLVGWPLVVGIAALVLAAIAVAQWGWRAGVIAAILGALYLVVGVTGDIVEHNAAEQQTTQPSMMRMHLSMMDAARRDDLQGALTVAEGHGATDEADNPWHLLAAAGEGLLVGGLACACLALARFTRSAGVPAGAVAREGRTEGNAGSIALPRT